MDASTGVVAIVDGSSSTTNGVLEREWRAAGIDARILTPAAAAALLRPGDTAIARIDIRATLDGLEAGLLELLTLIHRGVRVLNRPPVLLTTHDKLRTAGALAAAGVAHPRTFHLRPGEPLPRHELPLVVKPRFGSWGADVYCCRTAAELDAAIALVSGRAWFRRQGALVQELIPPRGYDLRVLVAGGQVVGAIRRRARPGDWRTNYSLGGSLEPIVAPADGCALALAAAAAVAGDFVGVDLLPSNRGYTVLEVNGAVDFEPSYALPGEDVYASTAAALALAGSVEMRRRPRPGRVAQTPAPA
jgi:RimK family alpha-L-glutamate ligase